MLQRKQQNNTYRADTWFSRTFKHVPVTEEFFVSQNPSIAIAQPRKNRSRHLWNKAPVVPDSASSSGSVRVIPSHPKPTFVVILMFQEIAKKIRRICHV